MNWKKLLPMLAASAAAALLLLRPQKAASAVRAGLALCAGTVVPSLFPFFAAISLLLQLGAAEALGRLCAPIMRPLFRMRGVCALPLLAGLLGGYPSGAKTAASLYAQGRITRQEAELLLGFCDNCGPAFLLGCVGAGVLGNPDAGLWLYAVHILSAILAGILLCRLSGDRGPVLLGSALPAAPVSFPQALTSSVTGALASTLNVCAFVVFFQVLSALPPAPPPPLVLGILEMVGGVASLTPGPGGFAAAAAIVGWGGLSVHCQAMSLAAPEGLSFRWHWAGKALQAVLSALLAAGIQACWRLW
ncbi:MAG: sporulation protein [Oscillospiraceae bacterium]|nr:sporulation protein [Oscillospiraceae bacterium]